MGSEGKLEKAKIRDLYSGTEVHVLFNPKEYTIKKSVKWTEHRTPKRNLPWLEFSTGEARSLSLELFIDTTMTNTDARVHTDKLYKLTLINVEKHEPPVCEFVWHKLTFKGIISDVSQRFTMFSSSGFPLRAVVSLTMKEFISKEDSKKSQNQSPDHTKTHIVKQGETLDTIAAREYDDPAYWKIIAEANDLADPTRLQPGTALTLPRLF